MSRWLAAVYCAGIFAAIGIATANMFHIALWLSLSFALVIGAGLLALNWPNFVKAERYRRASAEAYAAENPFDNRMRHGNRLQLLGFLVMIVGGGAFGIAARLAANDSPLQVTLFALIAALILGGVGLSFYGMISRFRAHLDFGVFTWQRGGKSRAQFWWITGGLFAFVIVAVTIDEVWHVDLMAWFSPALLILMPLTLLYGAIRRLRGDDDNDHVAR